MRKIFFLLFVFCAATSSAQNSNDNPVPDFILNKVIKSTDSFTFCNVSYKISRDCNKKDQSDCCSADLNPYNLQLSCYNGTTLTWSYYNTEFITRQNFESISAQWIQQSKKLSSENITCVLVNQKVPANKIMYETKEGHKFYCIITHGVINGKPVLVQLLSTKELKKNKDIQPVFQQIIKLSE